LVSIRQEAEKQIPAIMPVGLQMASNTFRESHDKIDKMETLIKNRLFEIEKDLEALQCSIGMKLPQKTQQEREAMEQGVRLCERAYEEAVKKQTSNLSDFDISGFSALLCNPGQTINATNDLRASI
jgi:hypothetical protein